MTRCRFRTGRTDWDITPTFPRIRLTDLKLAGSSAAPPPVVRDRDQVCTGLRSVRVWSCWMRRAAALAWPSTDGWTPSV